MFVKIVLFYSKVCFVQCLLMPYISETLDLVYSITDMVLYSFRYIQSFSLTGVSHMVSLALILHIFVLHDNIF